MYISKVNSQSNNSNIVNKKATEPNFTAKLIKFKENGFLNVKQIETIEGVRNTSGGMTTGITIGGRRFRFDISSETIAKRIQEMKKNTTIDLSKFFSGE